MLYAVYEAMPLNKHKNALLHLQMPPVCGSLKKRWLTDSECMIALQIIYKCAQPTLKTLAKSRQMKQFKEAKRRADIINMSTQRATILSQISRESREQTTFLD